MYFKIQVCNSAKFHTDLMKITLCFFFAVGFRFRPCFQFSKKKVERKYDIILTSNHFNLLNYNLQCFHMLFISLNINMNKAIEEICEKSTWHGSFSILAAVTGIWSKKTKNPFLDKVNGSMCAKFQVCIVFRLARRRETHK